MLPEYPLVDDMSKKVSQVSSLFKTHYFMYRMIVFLKRIFKVFPLLDAMSDMVPHHGNTLNTFPLAYGSPEMVCNAANAFPTRAF